MKIQTNKGEINISNEVFTTISGYAATNCFGVKGMAYRSMQDGLVQLLRRESLAKGIKITSLEDGTKIGIVAVPEQPTGMAFGGPDLKSLYITTQGTKIWQVDVKVPGIAQ